jgi:hypothetical protein
MRLKCLKGEIYTSEKLYAAVVNHKRTSNQLQNLLPDLVVQTQKHREVQPLLLYCCSSDSLVIRRSLVLRRLCQPVVEERLVWGVDLSGEGCVYTLGCRLETINV